MNSPLKILLCEDDLVSSFVLSKKLPQEQMKVVAHLENAQEIIATQSSLTYDLILMDVWLQNDRLGGLEAAEKIRSESDVPIIFQTGYLDPEVLGKLRAVSNSHIVQKPYQMEDLISLVQELNV